MFTIYKKINKKTLFVHKFIKIYEIIKIFEPIMKYYLPFYVEINIKSFKFR